jgi:hypothetical protein
MKIGAFTKWWNWSIHSGDGAGRDHWLVRVEQEVEDGVDALLKQTWQHGTTQGGVEIVAFTAKQVHSQW